MKNIYYFRNLSPIGGIETFFYQLAKKYRGRDLTIYYANADAAQLRRLKQYVRCVKYQPGTHIKCDRAFFNFNTDIIDFVDAKEYYLVVHGDYTFLNAKPPQHPKITKYLGVSKTACESFTKLTGLPCELAYNPTSVEEPKRLMRLVSACRLNDSIKGRGRVEALAKALDSFCAENNRHYIWTIFTNETTAINSPNVVYMKPRLDIDDYMADADYVVQLSDNLEGFNYTVNEALMLKTPVVVTPCDVYKELGIDKSMAIRLDFDLGNAYSVAAKMFDRLGEMSVKYTPPKDGWDKLLGKAKTTYTPEKLYKVRALKAYEEKQVVDTELGRVPRAGEVWEVTEERLKVLLGENNLGFALVEKCDKMEVGDAFKENK